MDMSAIAARLGLSGSRPVVRKAAELRRLWDINFDSSVLGIGEVCKAIIYLEIAATKTTLDVRELGIQFGCVRLIPFVQKGFVLYKERFLAALPPSRDFGRPVFTAAVFYLCAKRHKLKVDKLKLIDLCGTSSSESTTVSTSMGDLCFDVFGIAKEKKDPTSIKGNRDAGLPSKRKHEDDSDHSDESSGDDNDDELDLPTHKRHKKMEKQAYNQWKSSVISTSKQTKPDPTKPRKQAQLNFKKKPPDAATS
ncbi:hypothetical protein CFC21_077772 [Triticum aestivum]|uniref:Origin recognition complex subunit 6 n=3 Tax=Triticinae TaxID=1648030 RepID=A0A3B6MS90_WHEAT|nr:hypothetical protein CFC21_077772 [Triticum aestivum]